MNRCRVTIAAAVMAGLVPGLVPTIHVVERKYL